MTDTVKITHNDEIENEEKIDVAPEEPNNDASNAIGDPEDYKLIREMLKEMKEWGEMLRTETDKILKSQYGLSSNALYAIGIMTDASIEEATLDTYNEFYDKYNCEDGERDVVPSNDEEAITVLKEIKKLQANLYESETDYQKLQMDSNEIMTQYLTFMSSDAVIEARNKELESMKVAAEAEKDEVKRNEMLRKIHVMEEARTLHFIFARIEEYGEKEINNIVDAFFDDRKGNYVINKYKTKMKSFGFNPDTYKYFFHLEENFLPAQYAVFNNLFLFSYMRFIAYADPWKKSDCIWVQALTSAISNMVYHRYPNASDTDNKDDQNSYHIRTEALFIGLMMKYLDHFASRYDEFDKKNSTHPNHPIRIKADHQYEETRKQVLIQKMKDLHITGYEENWNANELQKFLNTQLEKLAETKKKDDEARAEESNTESKEDESSDESTDTAVVTDMTTEDNPVSNESEIEDSTIETASTEIS